MALLDLADDHDAAHIDAALRLVKDFSLAVDGGAHKGIFTRKMAECFAEVFAFEPQTDNYAALTARALPNVTAYPFALGSKGGDVTLAPGKDNTGQWHIASDDGDVPMLPLDAFRLSNCGFLKLDVEGYELFALEGARSTLRKFRPLVMIEENGLCRRYGVEPGETQRFIEGLGYRLVLSIGRDLIFEHSPG